MQLNGLWTNMRVRTRGPLDAPSTTAARGAGHHVQAHVACAALSGRRRGRPDGARGGGGGGAPMPQSLPSTPSSSIPSASPRAVPPLSPAVCSTNSGTSSRSSSRITRGGGSGSGDSGSGSTGGGGGVTRRQRTSGGHRGNDSAIASLPYEETGGGSRAARRSAAVPSASVIGGGAMSLALGGGGVGTGGSSAGDGGGAGPRVADAAGGRRPRVTISYEEEEDFTAVPARSAKTLKINIDLMLWRSRKARIAAQATPDRDARKRLLRAAEASLRRALALDPADPRTYVVLGKTLVQQKRYDEARRLYSEGTAATANSNAYVWSAWGWLEFRTGNVAAARKMFDAATVVDPAHACAWHKWGMLERSEGNYMRARDLWMQGIQRCRKRSQSQNAYLYNALAVMAAQLGRTEEARAWFDEGTRTLFGASSVALWQAWAMLEARQGDPSAVRYLFKRALGANARSRYVHLAWALWERRAGNIEMCLKLLARGNQLNPTDPAIYQAWAVVEKQRGRAGEARALFEAGTRADPGHLPLWQAWGCMEAELGDVERARELFQEGVWADPRSRDTIFIFHAWAVLERRCGNLGLARELFKAAIKVDPKSSKVWSTWINMEEELGQVDRADDLRMRQAEQQWEFEVPFNFTTRPPGSPINALVSTLQNFFTARERGRGGAGRGGARANGGGAAAASASGGSQLQQMLPDAEDLRAEDILPSLLPAQRRGSGDGDRDAGELSRVLETAAAPAAPALSPQPLLVRGSQPQRANEAAQPAVALPAAASAAAAEPPNGLDEAAAQRAQWMEMFSDDDGEDGVLNEREALPPSALANSPAATARPVRPEAVKSGL